MSGIDKRIEELEIKLKQAKALKQKQDAQLRAKLSKEQRAKDTRRKILVGAAILAKVERGEWPRDKLLAMMDATLNRNDDRALFDLEPATQGQFLHEQSNTVPTK
ncbi:MAG: mobilization protein [Proteobacteria bacterium]|nr:mobilization protein [Pseudomonadota bacterium]